MNSTKNIQDVADIKSMMINKYYAQSVTQAEIKASTFATYTREYAKYERFRDVMQASGKFNESKSKLSGQLYKSAIRYFSRIKIEKAVSADELRIIEADIEFADSLKKSMTDRMDNDLKKRLKKVEKKFPDWRQRLDARMTGAPYYGLHKRKHHHRSKYADQYIIQRATGCRNEELNYGVRVEHADVKFEYLIYIDTAKSRADDKRPDRTRVIRSNNELLGDLAGRTITLDNIDSYRKCIESATRAEFGIALSPYAFRYSVMADMKAAGAQIHERAEYLGHENTDTQGRYSNGLGNSNAREELNSVVEKSRVPVKKHDIKEKIQQLKIIQKHHV